MHKDPVMYNRKLMLFVNTAKLLWLSDLLLCPLTHAATSCQCSYLKTHEGLCGLSNVTGDIDALIDNLYSVLIQADEELGNNRNYPPNHQPEQNEMFDFIVVGAGAGGSAVANRLSEVTGWKVLLIEAGGDPPRNSEVPTLANSMRLTPVDWQYKTEPSRDNCRAFLNGSCIWTLGKALGGSTTLNGITYMRGNHKDYDDWNQPGWSFEEVLPYFKKSEDFRDQSILEDVENGRFHGVGGPVKLEPWLNTGNPIMRAFIQALQELGFKYNRDCNGKTQLGICPTYGFLEGYRRCSATKAYLQPIKNRTNLKVVKNSLVTKVLIKNNTAYGVEFINNQGRKPYTIQVRATKEIIVCGGSTNTPQILMLSGIGPKAHLTNLEIPIIKDLPVGQNLQDHLQLFMFVEMDYDPPENNPLQSTYDFLLKRPSPLSTFVGQEFTAFLDILNKDEYPDMQMFVKPRMKKNDPDSVKRFVKLYRLTKEIEDQLILVNKEKYLAVVQSYSMRPFSHGSIVLQSKDPQVYPKIIPGYLSDKRDVDKFEKIFQFVERLVSAPALRDMGAKLFQIRLPECERFPVGTYEYRVCYIRHLSTTGCHPSCTCAMGTVLDAQLRVRGVRRLRVADASVMPFVVSGNLNAPTYMIGEKAADMIKKSWLPSRG